MRPEALKPEALKFAAFALALLLASPASAADDKGALGAAANGFYGVYRTFHPSDGIPDAAGRARYRPFLSPALDVLLGVAADAGARFAGTNKDAPPLIEGDLFSSLFEGATAVTLGPCTGDAVQGRCTANLVHTEPGKQPTAWTDTVLLFATPTGWRVDDIVYGGSGAVGSKGSLRETLKQVIGFQ